MNKNVYANSYTWIMKMINRFCSCWRFRIFSAFLWIN
ncbi:unnamed protein product [Schistosoma curassoni]|uniref:Uncharacterized protein n=1 Tax=Schistosoma curassoni TaxID=6186 RepID=A0A183KVL8_9TREM|nr:unnamed protein product [Schistosoma curassoni]